LKSVNKEEKKIFDRANWQNNYSDLFVALFDRVEDSNYFIVWVFCFHSFIHNHAIIKQYYY